MTALPEPLVPADVDCTDLDGFMLNIEKLMGSELVALFPHEVIAAALFLWCRAWKQRPAASLPDDDRVNAAFAKLPLPRFKKLKPDILHGFVKCSDGRLYHRVLGPEAIAAYAKKKSFKSRREADAKRLREWRESKPRTPGETPDETPIETKAETEIETRFVQEGQGQGQGQGQGVKKEKQDAVPAAGAASAGLKSANGAGAHTNGALFDLGEKPTAPETSGDSEEKQLFARGKQVLKSPAAGGLIVKLLKAKGGSVPLARAAIELAATKENPREFLAAIIQGRARDGPEANGKAPTTDDAW